MIDPRIKFRHIQCFVEIVRQGSLKRASERLNLTQPAVSRTLKDLEETLDAALLERDRGGVTLTPQGEVFWHFAQTSLAALQQGLNGVDQMTRGGRTVVAVGALPSVAASLMPQVVAHLATSSPNMQLHIVEGAHGDLVGRLRAGALDMVIGRLGAVDTMQGLSFTQLYTEVVDMVVRPDHPLLSAPRLTALHNWPVIYPPRDSAIYALVESFMLANGIGDLPDKLETVSGAFAHVYTPASDAVWIISHGVVAPALEAGRLVRLPFDTSPTRGPIGVMTRAGQATDAATGTMLLATRKVLADRA
ncbi:MULTISPECIES: pca operon transcription factor PcaQ [Roseobacteraceae]|uniref:HTH-type transcriptional regulator GbpR n=1 Tax=Pseudosulfitobacter pseudonitzschiae TaxID=1402135 RepID=A0A221K5A6_9RHOB|nr:MULTISPECIES: pca operon transcription factor PcaQ [Roseobacteraceae]ASM74166.1 HTH-type transcriptional regulator GbpR [Pseudosulfitobacter pseudonitzschiae]